jgi:hypothetical protein
MRIDIVRHLNRIRTLRGRPLAPRGSYFLATWSEKYDCQGPHPSMKGCIIARSAWTVCIKS